MNIVDRAKNIIMTPKTEWTAIAAEEPNVGQIISGYVIPLALIPAIAAMLGWSAPAWSASTAGRSTRWTPLFAMVDTRPGWPQA